MKNNKLYITPVKNKADLDVFIQVPEAIYKQDPSWVTPLLIERRMHLSPKSNPYFQHAKWQAWIAWRGPSAVGRISAQVDSLHLYRYQDDTGFFGMLDAEDSAQTFTLLFKTAEQWLKSQGIKRIRGPFNLSINEEMGLLIEGFETPPFFMMGHARPYYSSYIETYGYSKAIDTFAYRIKPDFSAPAVMEKLLAKASDRIEIRPINLKNFDAEMATMLDIFNDAWSDNWGFIPFTAAEFHELGQSLRFLVAPELIQIAEVDGEAAAFLVALPNINEAIHDLKGRLFPFGLLKLLWRLKVKYPRSARVPLMGVRKKHQRTRLGPALAFLVIDATREHLHRRGVEKIELSWILENNAGMRNIIESIGGEAYKRYRVYEKNLNPGPSVENQ